MPAKTVKQLRFIYALRGRYKNKSKTPKKWKWIWKPEWVELKESKIICSFRQFNQFYKNI